jgi:hypothetical protein
MLWIVEIYILLGVIVNAFAIYKEPILIYIGWWLILYFILGIITFPYVLWELLTKDDTGRWI